MSYCNGAKAATEAVTSFFFQRKKKNAGNLPYFIKKRNIHIRFCNKMIGRMLTFLLFYSLMYHQVTRDTPQIFSRRFHACSPLLILLRLCYSNYSRVVNEPKKLSPTRTRLFKPEPDPNPNPNLSASLYPIQTRNQKHSFKF